MNLDTLCAEIREYMGSRGIVVFQSFPRSNEISSPVYWDTGRFPDYHQFLGAAEAAGVRLVALFARELEEDLVEDTIERLAEANFDRDERREMEARLKEIRGYAGFVCQVELSFDLAPRVYVFDLHTEWFDELNEILERIEDLLDGEEDGDGPLSGGYFSKN